MLKTEKIIIHKNKIINQWLMDSTLIYNQILYFLRQEFFQARKENRKAKYKSITELFHIIKTYNCWKDSTMDIVVKQSIIRQCSSNWFAYFKALKAYNKDKSKFTGEPKLPKYLKNGKTFVLSIDKTRIRKSNCLSNELKLPKFDKKFTIPTYIDKNKINCLRILKYYGKIKMEIIYNEIEQKNNLNKKSFIGIDLGVSNICTITSNDQNKSWIIKGGKIKSINQFYNKTLAKYKSELEICNLKKTSKKIEKLNYKRMNKINNYFHNISKQIINLCLTNKIGNIVIGHNDLWKQNCKMNSINNQNFIQIPFNKLISMIKYKAELQGITVIITEESYTSICDHLINEEMCHHNIYKGNRISRGLFKSNLCKIINADINGAIGILRKINAFSDIQLLNLRDRGDVVSPKVLFI